jgi:DNA-binding NarL/FixJ family response regulator
MCRAVVAEEDEIFRKALQRLLESGGVTVVAVADHGSQLIGVVNEFRPDVVLLDLELPGLAGFNVLRDVTRDAARAKVLVLSAETREGAIVGALQNGAAGYALKASPPMEIVEAVKAVAAGTLYLSAEITEVVVKAISRGFLQERPDPYDRLTRREREIFEHMAEGLSNSEIGARLAISPRTVETHRSQIRRRLDLKTQTDIIRFALRRGVVKLDP